MAWHVDERLFYHQGRQELNAPIVSQIRTKLILEFLAPNTFTACTITQRIASLDHELRYHTVEDNTLEIPAPCVAYEVLDCLWCLLWEQPQVDVTLRGVDRCAVCDWRWTCLERGGGCGDGTFVGGGSFVEDVTVARFFVPTTD